jgi:hypothetical protein
MDCDPAESIDIHTKYWRVGMYVVSFIQNGLILFPNRIKTKLCEVGNGGDNGLAMQRPSYVKKYRLQLVPKPIITKGNLEALFLVAVPTPPNMGPIRSPRPWTLVHMSRAAAPHGGQGILESQFYLHGARRISPFQKLSNCTQQTEN